MTILYSREFMGTQEWLSRDTVFTGPFDGTQGCSGLSGQAQIPHLNFG